MLTRSELERLAQLESAEGIVSFYLHIDPRLRFQRGLSRARFKSALQRFFRREQEDRWQKAAERERERIESYLSALTPKGRGLVVFACGPERIWETIHLEVPIPTALLVAPTTRTSLLARVLDEYPRFCACVVQRDRATIYLSEQREVERKDVIESEVPGAHSQGGFSQARFARHVDFHVGQHLRTVIERLEELSEELPFQRLLLGGTDEVTASLKKLLPEPLRRRLVGVFPFDAKHSTEDEVLRGAQELLERSERAFELEAVEKVVERAASGGAGVLGAEGTVRAALQGRAQKIVVVDDARHEGWACSRCDYFEASHFDTCPVCGAESESASDIVERALERAYLSGAEIDFVFGEARERLMPSGGLGALLRY